MCVRCENCGWIGSSDDLIHSYYDPSPAGISLPAGHYVEDFCPECGADQDSLDDDFDLEDHFDFEATDEYTAVVKAFCDDLKLEFSPDGVIDAITTSKGRWALTK